MTTAATHPPPGTFWRRRLVEPVKAQLTQGVSPDKIAATLAVGTVCSLFPFLGFTSLLNLAVGIRLRMNQPIMQVLNQLLGPIHIVMIVLYVRVGEWICRTDGPRFTVTEMVNSFRHEPLLDFLAHFGWAGIYAFTAWILSIPVLLVLIYYPARMLCRRLAGWLPTGD